MTRNAWLSLVALLVATPWRAAVGAETPHNFDQWEPEIAAFERTDHTQPPPRGALLFIGSSNIRLWKTLARDFPEHHVLNRGFGGSEIVDATHFAERVVFPCAPRMILLRAGGNDLWNGKSPEQVFADFRAFVAKVHAKLPGAKIVFISLSPSLARWKQAEQEKTLNTLVGEYVRQQSYVKYIETYPLVLGPDGQPRPELFDADKLHFNAAGYKLLSERVRPYLPNPAGAGPDKSADAKGPAGKPPPPALIDQRRGDRKPSSS